MVRAAGRDSSRSESIEGALVRECAEELGAEVGVSALLFVREYIHSRHELRGAVLSGPPDSVDATARPEGTPALLVRASRAVTNPIS